ncbi:PTS system mannose-specific transporter subunit IIA [Klebsiella variicola]|uniref:PTS system mannose-specific transporter subunit IIA n=1 Tax=Klebsiella variicola TaxID=244366 RepID=A0A7H4MMW4_KLEVA|nr:PTS system mannose-specific transporter subunit IIA [Klebsiella variicola]
MGPNDYMVIGLARIDDRLIHGQVATRWTKETNVTRIIVVSDEVAADTVRKTLLTQVAPPGVTAHVVDVAKMIRVYNNPMYAGQRVMLLFTNPTDVERIVEGGVKITSVNIGGMAFRQGKTQVNNAISVDAKDIEAFNKLNARGIELEARKVSTGPETENDGSDRQGLINNPADRAPVFTLRLNQQEKYNGDYPSSDCAGVHRRVYCGYGVGA